MRPPFNTRTHRPHTSTFTEFACTGGYLVGTGRCHGQPAYAVIGVAAESYAVGDATCEQHATPALWRRLTDPDRGRGR